MITMAKQHSFAIGLIIRFATVITFVVLSVASFIFAGYMFIVASSAYTFALACAFLALAVFAGFFNIYASISYLRSYYYDRYLAAITEGLEPLRKLPAVAVAMPVFNENPEMVKKNLTELFKMDYPKEKMKFYVVDDSTNPDTVKKLELFCRKNDIVFMHRNNREGCKAGAMNALIKIAREEYLAIFDADEFLTDRSFMKDVLPYFQDKGMAYVQTEKRYREGSLFSGAVDLFDAFFFKFIQPHRALNNTALFAGSCAIIRMSAARKIGGFPEYVTEDTFFSLESDLHNFKSLHVPKVYALGEPMETFSSLVKQQWRYNYGDTQFIKYYFNRSDKSKKLSAWANIDYYSHGFGLNYLSVILIFFTLLSILITFSALPWGHLTVKAVVQAQYMSWYLEILGASAFALSIFAPVILTKVYFGSVKKGFMIFVLNFALAIARAKAALSAIFKKDPTVHWVKVEKGSSRNLSYAIANTKAEIVLSASLLSLGFVAFLASNIFGAVWLATYGVLYLFATILLYKYG